MLEKNCSVDKTLQKHEDFGWLSNVDLHLKNEKERMEPYGK